MDGERKYLGMTGMQAGIVAGMAGVLVLILCVGGWFVLRNLGGGGVPVAQVAPTVQPTVTLVAASSPTPAGPPTLTPIPYEQLVPAGWNQYKSPLVEIWAPINFKPADKKFVNEIASSGTAIPVFILREVDSKSSLRSMLIAVSYEPLVGDSLDDFLDTAFVGFPYQARVTDRRIVTINSWEARRIVIEARVNSVDVNELIYVFLDGSTVWYVQYVAEIAEFFENLPVFDQAVKTFRPVKY